MVNRSEKCSDVFRDSLPTVVLFDIDGTLIDSQGSGGAALLSALEAEFGVSPARAVLLHGRTDLGIISEMLAINGIATGPENFQKLCARYFELLPLELSRRGGHILPGVVEILSRLREVRGCHVGLLTGNMPISARLKLEYFGLWDWFEFGIFGDQAEQRPQLSSAATAAINDRSGQALPADRIILVGDTPLDVELALTMRARCLAVGTGGFAPRQLRDAGACRAVDDLSQTADVFDWIFNQTELNG